MTSTTKLIPNEDPMVRVASCLDQSIDQIYLVITGLESEKEVSEDGDNPISRASITNLLRVVDRLSATRKTLGVES